jgi:hypothetical protein
MYTKGQTFSDGETYWTISDIDYDDEIIVYYCTNKYVPSITRTFFEDVITNHLKYTEQHEVH